MSTEKPEVLIAQRLHKKYGLSLPVDLHTLAQRFASLEYVIFPIDEVDGLALNIAKDPTEAKILINENRPEMRKRFTLAHEIGHVVIPWQLSSYIDTEIESNLKINSEYYRLENEANNFAAELLMPSDFCDELLSTGVNFFEFVEGIKEKAKVSGLAALIRAKQKYHKNRLVIKTAENKVIDFFATENLGFIWPIKGEVFDIEFYADQNYQTVLQYSHTLTTYTELEYIEPSFSFPTGHDVKEWREHLNDFVEKSHLSGAEGQKFKQSLNATVNYAYNRNKETNDIIKLFNSVAGYLSRKQQFAPFLSDHSFKCYLVSVLTYRKNKL